MLGGFLLEIVLTDVELVFAPGFIASVFRGEYPAFTPPGRRGAPLGWPPPGGTSGVTARAFAFLPPTSVVGTFGTCRPTLRMFANQG
jgi:hypothetical protein